MKRDFTFTAYKLLIETFLDKGYSFISFSDYCLNFHTPEEKSCPPDLPGPTTDHRSPITDYHQFVILRHDVDAKPLNSLRFAKWEHSLGIRGTYYFRTDSIGFEREIIRKTASLGHEIGYHYETVDQVLKLRSAALRLRSGTGKSPVASRHLSSVFHFIKTLWYSVLNSVKLCVTKKSPLDKQTLHHAYQLFTVNLRKLRRITPVCTICMHGSPLSPHDNREIWKVYDYRKHNILGDPTLDTDFSRISYLTDTGRRWNGSDVSIRDKVNQRATGRLCDFATLRETNGETKRRSDEETERRSDEATKSLGDFATLRETTDIIRSVEQDTFPGQVMLTVHPQRWEDEWWPWMKELVWQNLKNLIKKKLIKNDPIC